MGSRITNFLKLRKYEFLILNSDFLQIRKSSDVQGLFFNTNPFYFSQNVELKIEKSTFFLVTDKTKLDL